MILDSVVKVAQEDPQPRADPARQVSAQRSKGSEPAQVFPNDAAPVDPAGVEPNTNSAILEVKSAGPIDGEAVPGEVDPEYLQPNALVDQRRRPGPRPGARGSTRGVVDPWEKATAINQWVAPEHHATRTSRSPSPRPSEVARNLTGDCTEHSVLAAAMCRAVGVPSRVVVGLVYVDDLDGFGFHMWDEVFVNHRWVAIDPTFDQTTVDAVHIKLSDTSLEGVSPF